MFSWVNLIKVWIYVKYKLSYYWQNNICKNGWLKPYVDSLKEFKSLYYLVLTRL